MRYTYTGLGKLGICLAVLCGIIGIIDLYLAQYLGILFMAICVGVNLSTAKRNREPVQPSSGIQ